MLYVEKNKSKTNEKLKSVSLMLSSRETIIQFHNIRQSSFSLTKMEENELLFKSDV